MLQWCDLFLVEIEWFSKEVKFDYFNYIYDVYDLVQILAVKCYINLTYYRS